MRNPKSILHTIHSQDASCHLVTSSCLYNLGHWQKAILSFCQASNKATIATGSFVHVVHASMSVSGARHLTPNALQHAWVRPNWTVAQTHPPGCLALCSLMFILLMAKFLSWEVVHVIPLFAGGLLPPSRYNSIKRSEKSKMRESWLCDWLTGNACEWMLLAIFFSHIMIRWTEFNPKSHYCNYAWSLYMRSVNMFKVTWTVHCSQKEVLSKSISFGISLE